MNFEGQQIVQNDEDAEKVPSEIELPSEKGRNDIRGKMVTMAAGAATFIASTGELAAKEQKYEVPVTRVVNEEKILNVKPSESIIDVKHQEAIKNMDRSKLTERSAWATQLAEKIVKAKEMVKSNVDAISFIKSGFGAFGERYQEFLKNPAGCSSEDYLEVVNTAQTILNVFEEALDSVSVHRSNMGNERSYLTDAITRCESAHDNAKAAQEGPKFKF